VCPSEFDLAASPVVDDMYQQEFHVPNWQKPVEVFQQLWSPAPSDADQDPHRQNVAAMSTPAASRSAGVTVAPSLR
jgi:hypothetical protein